MLYKRGFKDRIWIPLLFLQNHQSRRSGFRISAARDALKFQSPSEPVTPRTLRRPSRHPHTRGPTSTSSSSSSSWRGLDLLLLLLLGETRPPPSPGGELDPLLGRTLNPYSSFSGWWGAPDLPPEAALLRATRRDPTQSQELSAPRRASSTAGQGPAQGGAGSPRQPTLTGSGSPGLGWGAPYTPPRSVGPRPPAPSVVPRSQGNRLFARQKRRLRPALTTLPIGHAPS